MNECFTIFGFTIELSKEKVRQYFQEGTSWKAVSGAG